MNKLFVILLVCLLLVASTAFFVSLGNENVEETVDCYVGISFCGNTTAEAKLLIDRVKDYTNLFVLQSGPVSENETATTEICDYAVDAGLDLIVYFGDLDPKNLVKKEQELGKDLFWRVSWVSAAKQKWGDSFLGVYYYDEPGGNWLDYASWSDYVEPIYNFTYSDVAKFYIEFTHFDEGYQQLGNSSITVFTSDYMLYWFDYLMGYDVMFAQLGWNHTIAQDIALVRGAADLQNKSWGTILTWKYFESPYLDTAENIYDQMVTSYDAGADYIIIFNYPTYPEGNPYGVMTDEHFGALESFWNDVVTNPEVVHGSVKAEAVLVLPQDYGWGMRYPEDTIWAFWDADEKSPQIWTILQHLLNQYGTRLDIVYDDPAFPVTGKYPQIYLWNQTTSNP
ncbi:MAG: hypothetical protein CW691_03775 [Candidatus Bathyarchaeum sp.]|nr:MAG: hypothetical protein CW691_03775 [Candidatus Bathyarchaeum sp.]